MVLDALEDAGIPAFGPRADAAIIEASKIFSKNLMAKYHIPTAKYQTFTELALLWPTLRPRARPSW